MKSVIAENLNNLLKIRNLTQKELAKMLKIKLPVLNRWINGKAIPTTKSLDKLSSVLKVPVSYFYTGTTTETDSKQDTLKDKEIELLKKEIDLLKKEIKM